MPTYLLISTGKVRIFSECDRGRVINLHVRLDIGAEKGTTDSTLISISSSNVATASKRLWAFAQWSRYVRPGAVRVGTSGTASGLSFSAFKNTDGTLSVQVLNSGTSAQSVTVAPSGYSATSAVAWVSDQATDLGALSITFSGGQATGSAPAHSMVTFVLKGATGGGGGGGGGGTTGCTTALYGQCGGTCEFRLAL